MHLQEESGDDSSTGTGDAASDLAGSTGGDRWADGRAGGGDEGGANGADRRWDDNEGGGWARGGGLWDNWGSSGGWDNWGNRDGGGHLWWARGGGWRNRGRGGAWARGGGWRLRLGERADGGVGRDGDGGGDGLVGRAAGHGRWALGDGDLVGGVHGLGGVASAIVVEVASRRNGGESGEDDGVLHFEVGGGDIRYRGWWRFEWWIISRAAWLFVVNECGLPKVMLMLANE